jgi:hypothetical protein
MPSATIRVVHFISQHSEDQTMSRQRVRFVTAAISVLIPCQLFAGGPPWLCLPIDGVTADNASQCARRLADASGRPLGEDGVEMREEREQWYARISMRKDVTLRQVAEALQDSPFVVPREKLRLFGHAILEIDIGAATADRLLADLEAMEYVAVERSITERGLLVVTVDMPYPVPVGPSHRESVRWDTFQRNEFSTPSPRSETPATARMLPSHQAFRDVVAKHHAALKDIRWSTRYACRPLGAAVYPPASLSDAS